MGKRLFARKRVAHKTFPQLSTVNRVAPTDWPVCPLTPASHECCTWEQGEETTLPLRALDTPTYKLVVKEEELMRLFPIVNPRSI